MMRGRALLLASALAGACAACTSESYRQRGRLPDCLAWLHEGTTERSEVVERLGQPRGSYENERIQTWVVDWHVRPAEQAADEDWYTEYSLVLVFDAADRVVRVSVVRLG